MDNQMSHFIYKYMQLWGLLGGSKLKLQQPNALTGQQQRYEPNMGYYNNLINENWIRSRYRDKFLTTECHTLKMTDIQTNKHTYMHEIWKKKHTNSLTNYWKPKKKIATLLKRTSMRCNNNNSNDDDDDDNNNTSIWQQQTLPEIKQTTQLKKHWKSKRAENIT